MNVNGAKVHRAVVAISIEDLDRPFDIHAELRFLLSRGEKGVGAVLDVGIHAQRRPGRCLRGRGDLLRQANQVFQLLFRFHVEVSDAGVQRVENLGVGLSHAGVDDPGRIGAGPQRPVQLPAADDVEPAAFAGQKPEDIHVPARLHGKADHRLQLFIGLLYLVQMVRQSGLAVNIGGRADLRGDALDVHLFNPQPAFAITEEIHRIISPTVALLNRVPRCDGQRGSETV